MRKVFVQKENSILLINSVEQELQSRKSIVNTKEFHALLLYIAEIVKS